MKHITMKKTGKRHFFWVFIAVLVVAIFVFFPTNKDVSDENIVIDEENTLEENNLGENTEEEVGTRQRYNDEIFNEEFEFDEYPFYLTQELDELFTYEVSFEVDKEIQFVVYSEERYNMWKESGMHTISKASTKSGPICCATNKSFIVEINQDEGGLYYFVFDDSNLPDKTNLPTKGKLVITKETSV